ncbi:hypothetical protein HAX54_008265, partial [Datura stramonium]|nr:hypothetical protein [Datura stramonium]
EENNMENEQKKERRYEPRKEDASASRKVQEKDDKARRLAEINRKNGVEDFKNASELRLVNQLLKYGEAAYDPFSRRWTRSTNYFVISANEATEGAPRVVYRTN